MHSPHSRSETSAITLRASFERRPVYPIMLYVETRTHASLGNGSLAPAVKRTCGGGHEQRSPAALRPPQRAVRVSLAMGTWHAPSTSRRRSNGLLDKDL